MKSRFFLVSIIPTEGATDRPKKCGRFNARIYAGVGATTFFKVWKKVVDAFQAMNDLKLPLYTSVYEYRNLN